MDDLDDLLDCEQDLFSVAAEDEGTASSLYAATHTTIMLLSTQRNTASLAVAYAALSPAGPPVKRRKPSVSTADIDDDELIQLAQTQWTQSHQPLQLSDETAKNTAINTHYTGQDNGKRTQDDIASMDEEQQLAELVQLANNRLASSSLAAAHQLPEASNTPMQEEQPDNAVGHTTSAVPSWSGAEFEGDSFSVTVGDGRRAYCRLHNSLKKVTPHSSFSRQGQLLSVPISTLLHMAEQESFDKAMQESKKFAELTEAFDGELDESDILPATTSSTQQTGQKNLWVDKYSPKSFFELLSEEKVNIEVIKWVKAWDGIAHRKTAKQQQARPEQKLLMLCGPPGMTHLFWIIHCPTI